MIDAFKRMRAANRRCSFDAPPAASGRSRSRCLLGVAALVAAGGLLAVLVPLVGAGPWDTVGLFGPGVLLLATSWPVAPRPGILSAVRIEDDAFDSDWLTPQTRGLIDVIPDACFVVDRNGLLLFANVAAVDQFGPVRSGDPLSFKLRVPVFLDALELALQEGRRGHISWSEKVPTERWYEAFMRPLAIGWPQAAAAVTADSPAPPASEIGAGPSGGATAIFIRDLTEQRQLERLRQDFIANASHELRTPLASLTGFIETLQGPARNDTQARKRFLEIMHDQAERMRRLIDDLLSLSRIEMRAHLRPRAQTDLAEAAVYAVDSLRPVAAESDVTLIFEGVPAGLPVHGDRDELVQVFENLVQNAIKYGATGKRIVVSAQLETSEGQQIGKVAVQDFGPGIAPQHLPRLTERFYRVDAEPGQIKRGTGLGLAIVKHILARHRGHLAIASTVGEGAMFTVRIALASPAQEPVAASE